MGTLTVSHTFLLDRWIYLKTSGLFFLIFCFWCCLCVLQVTPSLCWPLRASPTRPCRCPSSPSAASAPLRTLRPPNLRTLTLDLPSVMSTDLLWRSSRSQPGEKRLILQEPWPLGKQKKIWEKAEAHVSFLFFFSPLRGHEYLTCIQSGKNDGEAFIISRNSQTIFYTTKRTHFASSVQHLSPLYSSTLWAEGGGSLKGMRLIREAGLKPLECCQKAEDKQKKGTFKEKLSLWPMGQALTAHHSRGKTPPSFLSNLPWRKGKRKQSNISMALWQLRHLKDNRSFPATFLV